jgi:hypothetical protein
VCVPFAAALISMAWRPLRGGRLQYLVLLAPLALAWWCGGIDAYHALADGGIGLDSRIVAAAEAQTLSTGRPIKVVHETSFNELFGTLLVDRSSSDGEYPALWTTVGADPRPVCTLVPVGTTVWDFRGGGFREATC